MMPRGRDGFAKSVASCRRDPTTWLNAAHRRRSPNSTSLRMTGSKAPKFNARKNPATAGDAIASMMEISAVSGWLPATRRRGRRAQPTQKSTRHTTWTKMSMRTLARARLPPRTPNWVRSLAPMMSPPTRANGNREFIASRMNRTPTKGSGAARYGRFEQKPPSDAGRRERGGSDNDDEHRAPSRAGHGLDDGGEPVIRRQTGQKRQAEQRGERSEKLHRGSIVVFDRGTADGEVRRRMLLNPLRMFINPNLPDVTSKCRRQWSH